MSTSDVLSRFKSHLSQGRYSGARYAFAAVSRGGKRHNIWSRITWWPSRQDAPMFRSRGQGLTIEAGWIGRKDALHLLDTLAEGLGTIAGHKLQFLDVENNRPYGNASDNDGVMWAQPYIGWSGHFALLSGLQMGSLLRDPRLAWFGDRLSSLRPGRVMTWRDVERIIGPKSEISDSRVCGIELFAPLPAKLLEARLRPQDSVLAVPIETFANPIETEMELVVQATVDGVVVATIPATTWKRGKGRIWTALV